MKRLRDILDVDRLEALLPALIIITMLLVPMLTLIISASN